MGQKREVERFLNDSRGLIHRCGVALEDVEFLFRIKCGHDLVLDLGAVTGFGIRQVPFDGQQITRLHRGPGVFGIDRHGGIVGQCGGADEAGDCLRLTIVKAGDQTAHLRGTGQHGDHLTRQIHVHGAHGRPIALDCTVETPHIRVADQAPLIGRFENRFFRRCQFRCSDDEIANGCSIAHARHFAINDIQ